MRFFVLLDAEGFTVEASTGKVDGVLPREFFDKPRGPGYHPIMNCEGVNTPVHEFLTTELTKRSWLERVVFRFLGSVVHVVVDDGISHLVSGWELDNLMEYLLHARVVHVGLHSENRSKAKFSSTGQQFLKWPDRTEWKKPIAEGLATRYCK
jgi:hypothetical protein